MIRKVLHILFHTLPFMIIVCVVVQLIFSNELVSSARRIQEIERERDTIEIENERIEQQVAIMTSLTVLEKKATELGFIRPKQIMSIRADSHVVALSTSK